MVDITNSLEQGYVDSTMLGATTHYAFIQNPPYKINHTYIARDKPDEVKPEVQSDRVVSNQIGQDRLVQESHFQFICSSQYPFKYYCVQNPINPGANGIKFPVLENYRYLIVSGGLSGCAFAILSHSGCLYIIHSGGDSGNSDVGQNLKRKLINRDVYLMAEYLKGTKENYQEKLVGLGEKIQNGLTNEELFDKIIELGFEGAIGVRSTTEMLLRNENGRLTLSTYDRGFCDTIYVRNENGKYGTAIRSFLTEGGKVLRINGNKP